MAAHSAGTAVRWVQHDIWILYGNPGVSAPAADDRYKPAFSLSSSTNTLWYYTVFNDANELRSGGWGHWGNVAITGSGGVYTATQRTLAAGDYEVLGAWLDVLHSNAYGWWLANPCGIVNITWQDGKKRRAGDSFLVHCRHWPRGASWWITHYSPTSPASPNTWESWSYSGSAFAVSDIVAIAAYFFPQDVEAGTVTVTLNSAETPTVMVGGESGGYHLDAVLENTTTGEAIRITAMLALNTELRLTAMRARSPGWRTTPARWQR